VITLKSLKRRILRRKVRVIDLTTPRDLLYKGQHKWGWPKNGWLTKRLQQREDEVTGRKKSDET
jgi:hypothetical protein